jgi:hypothetical protein
MKIHFSINSAAQGTHEITSQESDNPLDIANIQGASILDHLPGGLFMHEAEGIIEGILDREHFSYINRTTGGLKSL